jgi:hypothetical protein
VETAMLFTPRLFEFKTASMDFSDATNSVKVAGMYADIAYCAALNYWTLVDNDIEDFQLKRIDFHEWSAINPSDFGKMMRVAVEALTNKSLAELAKEHKDKAPEKDGNVKKKTFSSIIKRLKIF